MTTVSWLRPLKFEAERTIARHTVQVGGSTFAFCLAAPGDLSRRTIGEALAGAVAELRAVDAAFSPYRQRSLVSRIRRGELNPAGYPPPLVEVVRRCAALRATTDGWFDAWALPGGFDPGGMVRGTGPAAVTGPTLAMADGLATALYAAGEAGLSWFPGREGYRALVVAGRKVAEPVTLR